MCIRFVFFSFRGRCVQSSRQMNPRRKTLMTYLRRGFGLALAALTLLATLAPNAALLSHAQDANAVTVDGSSIVSPVVKYAADAYQKDHKDAKITVKVSGTDAGFEKLCAGSIDMAMAARNMNDAEA